MSDDLERVLDRAEDASDVADIVRRADSFVLFAVTTEGAGEEKTELVEVRFGGYNLELDGVIEREALRMRLVQLGLIDEDGKPA